MPRANVTLIPTLLALAGLAIAVAQSSLPAEPSEAAPLSDAPHRTEELQVVRQLLEQQSRQIETLTQQIAKLNQLLEESHDVPPAPMRDTPPVTEPVASSPAQPPPPSPALDQRTHIVSKGETLTSIAREYNVTVGDLMQVNTVTDDRKLQIGQVIVLPAAATENSPPKPKQEP